MVLRGLNDLLLCYKLRKVKRLLYFSSASPLNIVDSILIIKETPVSINFISQLLLILNPIL